MGTSIGAVSSILAAVKLAAVDGVIAENPFRSYQRNIADILTNFVINVYYGGSGSTTRLFLLKSLLVVVRPLVLLFAFFSFRKLAEGFITAALFPCCVLS
jgi:hypothetical protein